MKIPKLLLLISLLGLIPGRASADPYLYDPDSQPRGPYLQLGTPTEITVRWRTEAASNSVVRYGTSVGSLTSTVSDSASTKEHIIRLTNLTPNTKYYYSVGSSSATIASGADCFFVTSPTTAKPTRIWVLGDPGHATPGQAAVRDAYEAYAQSTSTHTDLWLTVGDNVYEDGTDTQYTDKFFEYYPAMLRKSVLWPSLGNHDRSIEPFSETGVYYDTFTLPTAGQAGGIASNKESYYSFDYGNIHFVCLESTKMTVREGLAWLDNDLKNHALKDWIIVYFHHAPYTKGAHNSDNEAQCADMRVKVLPILEKYGVDLVVTGHSHSYERSKFIDGHYGVSSTFDPSTMVVQPGDGAGSNAYLKPAGKTPHAGTVYVVTGSAGAVDTKNAPYPFDHPAMQVSMLTLGSLVIDVNGNTLDAKFIGSTTNPVTVLDSFRIIKGSSGNVQPSVTLTSPAANSSYASPASISLGASASDTDGTITKVEFYQGSTFIGSDTSSPYTYTWTGMAPGTYSITAVATDNGGATKTSGAVTVTVTGGSTTVTTFQEGANGYTGMIDAYIRADATTTNTGTAAKLMIDGNPDYAALLKWDLSSIPTGRTVTDVKMALNVTDTTPHTYEIYALKRAWTESDVTWVKATSTTNWASAGADNTTSDRGNVVLGTATTGTNGSTGTLTIALNAAGIAQVQSWVDNPSTNHGFVIQDYVGASDGLDFTSSEGTTVAHRPSLTVTYTGQPTVVSFQQGTNGYLGMTDTHLRANSTTSPVGTAATLLLDGDPDYSALLKWNLSSIPAGKTVTAVSLTFHVTDPSTDVFEIYALKRAWTESDATWIKATSTVNWSVAGAIDTSNDREATVLGLLTASSIGPVTIPLNSAGIAKVQSWINNPATNFGFIIQDYVNTGGLDMISAQGSTVSQRPIITITYQ